MAVLVDYACPTCDGRFEAWMTPSPIAVRLCPSCGGEARRVWAPVGLLRSPDSRSRSRGAAPRPPEAGVHAADLTAGPPLCAANPNVPGLCHMTPSAARAWLARARGDTRSLERELARQEVAAKLAPPDLASVVSHGHHHGKTDTESDSRRKDEDDHRWADHRHARP